MIRALLFLSGVAIFTALGAISTIVIGTFKAYAKTSFRYVARPWGRVLVWLSGSRVRVGGTEHLEADETYIVVSNHQSLMDIPVLFGYLPMMATVIAKKELFRIPLFAQGMRALGILKIDRSNRSQAFQTLRSAAEAVRRHHISVLAFPEGTRSQDGRLQPFKKGAFVLAIKTGIPLLPLTVSGTAPILPKGKLRVRAGDVRIQIHPPVPTRNLEYGDRDRVMREIHHTIEVGLYENATITS